MNMKRILLTALTVFAITVTASANSQYKLYAGFMYHFAKFTQWPADKQDGDFVIGIIGSSDMVEATTALASSKRVGARNIVVKSFHTAAEAKGCHMVFISKAKESEIAKATELAKIHKFLVITESSSASSQGSTINFVENAGRIQFELSKSAADAQGLRISSELQKLAIMKS